ncbi:MAG: DUF1080 domain-containing protein [Gemmataceae bacterium]|nr:DUF1080 domain-containing protein [Gemmataceae bacterium]
MTVRILILAMLASSCATAPARSQGDWQDLFPGKNLAGWKRVPLAPDTKLNEKNPWSVDTKSKVLLCDGVGVKEMLLFDKEFGDGVFHLEWRFRKVEGDPVYNSGVYIRSKSDGVTWHQVQLAHTQKPPFMGDIFRIPDVAKPAPEVVAKGDGPKHVKPPGEWNTYDITCKGKTISVAVNGTSTCTWNDCPVPRGYLGMQAEFFVIEFRNLRFRR